MSPVHTEADTLVPPKGSRWPPISKSAPEDGSANRSDIRNGTSLLAVVRRKCLDGGLPVRRLEYFTDAAPGSPDESFRRRLP